MKQSLIGATLLSVVLFLGATSCTRDVEELSEASQTSIAPAETPSLEANGNVAAAHLAASETLEIPSAVALPENLPGGNTRVATYYAVGVQKYKARIKPGTSDVLEWVFVAPQADLYDGANTKIGTHGAGPVWKLFTQDSIVAMHFLPMRTAPSNDPESIDWLLLQPKTGITPTGIFADVDYIQRIATKGGKAPVTPPASLDATADVKYKAIYRISRIN